MSSSMKRVRRRPGLRGWIGILASVAALSGGASTLASSAAYATDDPGCSATAPGPGVRTVCLNESHEGATAATFPSISCDQISSPDPTLDYFIFVLPASGDPGRYFTGTPQVYFDSNLGAPVDGTIANNPKFFYAAAGAGSTLLEAVAQSNNKSLTPTGGEATQFNLTHTCPATQGGGS